MQNHHTIILFFFSLSSQFLEINFLSKFLELAKSSSILFQSSAYFLTSCVLFPPLGLLSWAVLILPLIPPRHPSTGLLIPEGVIKALGLPPTRAGQGLPTTGEQAPRLATHSKTMFCVSNSLKNGFFPSAAETLCLWFAEIPLVLYLFALISITWLWGGLHMAYRHLWMLVFFIIFNSLQVRASIWSFGLLADLGVFSPLTFVMLASPAEHHPVTHCHSVDVHILFTSQTDIWNAY